MKNIITLLSLPLLFYSCEKNTVEIETHPGETGPYLSLADFYDQNETEDTVFIIDPQQPIQISGSNGIQISIPPNSLFDSNGQLPSGPVTVSMKEIHDVKSMVLSHVPSASNGIILESAGMLYIDFSINAIHYKALYSSVIIPSQGSLPNMKIFFGVEDFQTGINWLPADSLTNFVSTDSTGIDPSYFLTIDSLGGWINCARAVFSAGPPITIISQVDAWRGETVDMAVYLLFPSINSCINAGNTSGPQTIINNMPIGMNTWAAVIGIGRISRKSYFGIVNFTISAGPPIVVTLTQADEEITTALEAL